MEEKMIRLVPDNECKMYFDGDNYYENFVDKVGNKYFIKYVPVGLWAEDDLDNNLYDCDNLYIEDNWEYFE